MDQEQAVTRILERVGTCGIVVTPNIVQVHQAYNSEPLRKANELAFFALPDGWPVAALGIASRAQGRAHTFPSRNRFGLVAHPAPACGT
ncbi:hypothetical protein [Rhodococcoides kroppenstedtii]|uniref:hypothetical protein n=1 Tax=Rhodococcoides kroppenstedtii TaxID=293050 RepID=UPI001BDE42B4|nr:hypothetical protein [Rhodococcus kroppenstedtii]MBT1191099.1 hypothetical protein [Rhodococcus kroppenstedtii]